MYFDNALPESLYSRISYNWHAFEDASLSKLVCKKKGNSKMNVKKSSMNKNAVASKNVVVKSDNCITVTPVASCVVPRWAIVKKEDLSLIDLYGSRESARVYRKAMNNYKDYTIRKALVTIF